ncbi:Cytoskeletal signaling slm1 [Hyphodiscus hymeniophilus]|uniref:Cytoskeletal signaling slm1 n=1 Tax=Hyphodiscus hymeniophilus TaxID=353542 RepID=A0A9P6VQ75_9HELO|nr:Cytoskeletal signaling slm1 [Hyphodiscus hymeniophilus]
MSEKVGLAGNINVPMRQASTASAKSDDAVPTSDPSDTSSLLAERLQAWKHAVGYLEDYVSATEKVEKAHAKEYEKVLKTIQNPLKEGHHFDQSLGGIAGMFENMRQNTQGIINSHLETEKNLKGSVLPILDRLHKEIKNKSKELSSGAVKGAKEVDKVRNTTQKHIELLGQQTASHESSGGRINANDDPYVVQRQVYHRLNKQVLEENNNRHDLIAVQNNFVQFEAHVIEVIQQAMMTFNQFVGGQAAKDQELLADMLGAVQAVPPNFEWAMFAERSQSILIDPNSSDRTVDGINFPNQNHKSTKPLIEGTLERKSRNKLSMSGYSTGYYVVTPSKYLHEFKDNDNFRKDPTPEMSIYLPDATIGAPSNEKFNVKGKDVSKGLSSKLSGSSEVAFKAHTAADAAKWFEVIRAVAGAAPAGAMGSEPSSPVSPVEKRVVSQPPTYVENGASGKPAAIQTSGVTSGETVASPSTATPVSARPVGDKF